MPVEHTFKWRNGTRTERLTVARAIRIKCYECMNWEPGVERLIRDCPIQDCALWPFRLGNPEKRSLPTERVERLRERMRSINKSRFWRQTHDNLS